MLLPLDRASPLDLSALWRLGLLSGDDVAAICMRWLEEDLDGGDPDIAAFAGAPGLTLAEVGFSFERALKSTAGRSVEGDEALLRALRIHLATALERGRLIEGVQATLQRFAHVSDRRLVRHPRRRKHRPNETYAAQNLGLEYVYGRFYDFDDVVGWEPAKQAAANRTIRRQLRREVVMLHDHLSTMLGAFDASKSSADRQP